MKTGNHFALPENSDTFSDVGYKRKQSSNSLYKSPKCSSAQIIMKLIWEKLWTKYDENNHRTMNKINFLLNYQQIEDKAYKLISISFGM